MTGITVRRADYTDARDRAALLDLLDAYAQDPMGGGEPLPASTRARLCEDLAARPLAASFIAWLGDEPVGLVNTFEGYSTFKARPLLNVHDIAVLPAHRARGVGQALLAACEAHASERRAADRPCPAGKRTAPGGAACVSRRGGRHRRARRRS